MAFKKITKTEDYIEKYFQLRKKFIHAKERSAGVDETSLSKWKKRVEAQMAKKDRSFTIENARKSMQELLNTNLYTDYKERVHKNVTKVLKEEGMTSRLYRMGGKTAMDKTSFIDKVGERDINGEQFKAKGYYRMGTVKVIFWTSKDGSREQYIEFINIITGQSHLQLRKSTQYDE